MTAGVATRGGSASCGYASGSEAGSARVPFSLHFVLVWMVNHGFVPASVDIGYEARELERTKLTCFFANHDAKNVRFFNALPS